MAARKNRITGVIARNAAKEALARDTAVNNTPRCTTIADGDLSKNYSSFLLAFIADTVSGRLDQATSRATSLAVQQLATFARISLKYEEKHGKKLLLG